MRWMLEGSKVVMSEVTSATEKIKKPHFFKVRLQFMLCE